jgi:hypothetical protein
MELNHQALDISQTEESNVQDGITGLSDLELTLVGGGTGDVTFG